MSARYTRAAQGLHWLMAVLILAAYLLIYVFLLGSYMAVLLYLARHRGKPDHKPAVAGLQEA